MRHTFFFQRMSWKQCGLFVLYKYEWWLSDGKVSALSITNKFDTDSPIPSAGRFGWHKRDMNKNISSKRTGQVMTPATLPVASTLNQGQWLGLDRTIKRFHLCRVGELAADVSVKEETLTIYRKASASHCRSRMIQIVYTMSRKRRMCRAPRRLSPPLIL